MPLPPVEAVQHQRSPIPVLRARAAISHHSDHGNSTFLVADMKNYIIDLDLGKIENCAALGAEIKKPSAGVAPPLWLFNESASTKSLLQEKTVLASCWSRPSPIFGSLTLMRENHQLFFKLLNNIGTKMPLALVVLSYVQILTRNLLSRSWSKVWIGAAPDANT